MDDEAEELNEAAELNMASALNVPIAAEPRVAAVAYAPDGGAAHACGDGCHCGDRAAALDPPAAEPAEKKSKGGKKKKGKGKGKKKKAPVVGAPAGSGPTTVPLQFNKYVTVNATHSCGSLKYQLEPDPASRLQGVAETINLAATLMCDWVQHAGPLACAHKPHVLYWVTRCCLRKDVPISTKMQHSRGGGWVLEGHNSRETAVIEGVEWAAFEQSFDDFRVRRRCAFT